MRRSPPRVLALHKPRGVVVSREPQGSPGVFELLPERFRGWWAVGRLDKDSEGLLLFADDARWAQRMMDPGGLAKTYLVTVEGLPSADALERLRRGGLVLDGRALKPIEVRRLGKAPRGGTRLEVVLHEGVNRQIRRLFANAGHKVRRLIRIAIGPIEVGDLQPGACRELSTNEVRRVVEGLQTTEI